MNAVRRKYKRLRSSIESGDIILVRGRSLLTRIIEWADGSYYSHALVVFKVGGRLFAIQSMADGVVPFFLSTEIFANIDFCILKPVCDSTYRIEALNAAFKKAERGIPYDYLELPKILLTKKLGIKFKNIQGNKHENICSVFAGHTYAGKICPSYEHAYKAIGYLTPQDLVRFAQPSEIQIIGNNPHFIN